MLVTNFMPSALAKTPPDKLLIIDFSNEIELVIEDKEFVNQMWTSYSPMGWLIGSFQEKKGMLEGLSRYGFQFVWSDNRGSMPVTYYYASNEFPDGPAKESSLAFPGDDPRYVSKPDEAFNWLMYVAYVSAKEQLSLSDLKLVNNTLLVPFEEGIQHCCHALDISPDGSTIAYSTAMYDNQTQEWIGHLWLYDLNSNIKRQLDIGKIGIVSQLRFNPSGDKLLFVGDGCEGVCLFSLAQNKLNVIALDGVEGVDWMPDGSLVLSEYSKGNYTISIYEGEALKELYRYESLAIIPLVRASPDGKRIAFVIDKPLSILEIYVLDVESGEIREVVGNEFRPLKLRWSADGKYLVYIQSLSPRPPDADFGKNNPHSLINVINLSNNETAAIVRPSNAMVAYDLAISPDSMKIIYALDALSSFPYVPPTVEPGIYVAELSQAIPEFPVNLMVITAIGLIGVLILLRTKHKRLFK